MIVASGNSSNVSANSDAQESSNVIINTALYEISGLSVCEIEFLSTVIRSDSGLAGLGEVIALAEETHSVNALFILAVASHESGHGLSHSARTRNNLFGIMYARGGQVRYSSKSNSVMDFARLISERYFANGRTSVSTINNIYAPHNPEWSGKVNWMLREFERALVEKRESELDCCNQVSLPTLHSLNAAVLNSLLQLTRVQNSIDIENDATSDYDYTPTTQSIHFKQPNLSEQVIQNPVQDRRCYSINQDRPRD